MPFPRSEEKACLQRVHRCRWGRRPGQRRKGTQQRRRGPHKIASGAWIEDYNKGMAERVGFEPTIPVKVCPLSRRIVSTTHAPLRKKQLPAISLLATISKERLHNFCAATGQHASLNLHLMVQVRMIDNLHHRADGARFWIVRTIH